jgi:hypothetical protein
MSKKKSKKHLVGVDDNNQPFCFKCGRADFSSVQSSYGHLSQCKGYNTEIKKYKKIMQDIGGDAGLNPTSEPEKNSADTSLFESAPISLISEKAVKAQGTQALPRPYLGPALGPTLSSGVEENLSIIALENERLRKQNTYLKKIAFNHNEHYSPPARRGFSGPMDIVGDFYETAKGNQQLYNLIVIGLLAWGGLYLWKEFDKLNNKNNNRRR